MNRSMLRHRGLVALAPIATLNRVILCATMIVALFSKPTMGQDTRVQLAAPVRILPGAPICSSCKLEVKKILVLGDDNDSELLHPFFPRAALDQQGRFLIPSMGGGFNIYDQQGKFLRTFGRSGQGPNEFGRAATVLLPSGDSALYVGAGPEWFLLGPGLREVSRFNAGRAPSLLSRVVLGNGGLVLAGSATRRDTSSARRDTTVTVATAFGAFGSAPVEWALASAIAAKCRNCLNVKLSAASTAPNELWALYAADHQLKRWREDGVLLETVSIVDSPWYLRWQRVAAAVGAGVDLSAAQRSDGLLVIAANGPAGHPPAPTGRAVQGPIGQRLSVIESAIAFQDSTDTVIEILDPASGILASTAVPNIYLYIMSPSLAYRHVITASGLLRVEIWQISFTR